MEIILLEQMISGPYLYGALSSSEDSKVLYTTFSCSSFYTHIHMLSGKQNSKENTNIYIYLFVFIQISLLKC